jgi:hypothetical protein
MRSWYKLIAVLALLFAASFSAGLIVSCSDDSSENPTPGVLHPVCNKPAHTRIDAYTPASAVPDWGTPVRLDEPINTPCPEDAIEISRDGEYLYFMFTQDILEDMTPEQILARENNTYRAHRVGGPDEFEQPLYYDLARGTDYSLDGELSFTSDGSKVYFHSNRPENTGYQEIPSTDDYLDIYVADIVDGKPGPGVNLGPPVNSAYPDGEHAIYPDDSTLYFTSLRPDGIGGADIYRSVLSDGAWSIPENLDFPVNSFANDLQPAFTADGDTMYFVSDRNMLIGAAIYRSVRNGDLWTSPELVIDGIVGEPSLTGDGEYLYFVHVLSDTAGTYDADVWYSQRVHP